MEQTKAEFLDSVLGMVNDLPDAKLIATNFDGSNLEALILCAITMGRDKERHSITKKFGKEMEKLVTNKKQKQNGNK